MLYGASLACHPELVEGPVESTQAQLLRGVFLTFAMASAQHAKLFCEALFGICSIEARLFCKAYVSQLEISTTPRTPDNPQFFDAMTGTPADTAFNKRRG